MITIDQVEPVIRNLPEDLRVQVLQYIEIISQEHQDKGKHFSFDWVGDLEDEEPSLSTVELQHKIHALKV